MAETIIPWHTSRTNVYDTRGQGVEMGRYEGERARSPGRRHAWRLIQGVVLFFIVLFWARTLVTSWPHLAGYPWQVGWLPLVLALGLLVGQMVVLATAWHRSLAAIGAPIPWRRAASVWLRAQIARYIPGGVWDVAGRVALSRELPMPTRAVPAAAMLEVGLQVLSAGMLLLVTLLVFPIAQARHIALVTAVALLLALAALTPAVFQRAINLGLRILRRRPLTMRLTYASLARLFLYYAGAHLLQGAAFVLFVRGLGPVTWSQAPRLMGAYVGAWLVGYVIAFAPGGIGVREAALFLLLEQAFSRPVVIGAALGFRVWVSLRDLVAAAIGLVLART